MAMMKTFFGTLRRFWPSREGTSTLELAVCLPLLVGMLIPIADLGMGAYTQMEVQNAAQAGAEYAAVTGYNSGNIQNAVTSATSLSGVSASPAPSQSCGCVSGTSISSLGSPPCGETCGSGTVGTFVTVNAQATYTPLLPYPWITSPMTLTAQSTIRIK